METENKRIPFDWEKYQSGEYTPICGNGDKPEQLTHNPKADTYVVAAWVNDVLRTFTETGKHNVYNQKSDYDLFLIPKPKRFQAWVNLYSDGECYSYYTEKIAKRMIEVYRTKNREIIETRLIEWEG
jgi:hypothetical protein